MDPTSKKVRFGVVHAWSKEEHMAIMEGTSLNYFTCTLGEAARWNAEHPHPFYTVNDLIDEQAEEFRQRTALNVASDHTEDGKEAKSDFTYRELRDFSLAAAARLRRRLQGASLAGSGTVGLLCSSTIEFILTWLGLMRLGVPVMLLTPGLRSAAIRHLCSAYKVSTIFVDARNYEKVKDLKDGMTFISASNVLASLKPDPIPASFPFNPNVDNVAYILHTCVSSSDLPEPVPQSHLSAVSVLPHLPHADGHATFSATPLYHGGVIDCLRAWASGATIHLFPSTQPITAANVHAAVDRANSYLHGTYPVRYFTCESDLLQSLSRETSDSGEKIGLRLLQQMELVGVPGPGLSPMIGGYLVASDVKLVMRYISAECGFMLSSHRDYQSDREWSYFRADPMLQPDYYDFEPQAQSGKKGSVPLFEFVIKSKWPTRRATNRPDGSFATADLFERHPTIPDTWQYHGRAGEHVTLLDGTTFDPAPVEEALLASEVGRRMLVDAMVFGMGMETPGVLLSPMWAESFVGNEHVVDEVWPTIEKMNKMSQSQVKIPRSGLVVARMEVQTGKQLRLPRNSKGLLLRGQTERMFTKDIQAAYSSVKDSDGNRENVPDDKVMDELTRLFDETMGRHMDTKSNLSAQGIDSTVCSHLRNRISKTFFPDLEVPLPPNIIQAQGSIENLSRYILQRRGSVAEASEDIHSNPV